MPPARNIVRGNSIPGLRFSRNFPGIRGRRGNENYFPRKLDTSRRGCWTRGEQKPPPPSSPLTIFVSRLSTAAAIILRSRPRLFPYRYRRNYRRITATPANFLFSERDSFPPQLSRNLLLFDESSRSSRFPYRAATLTNVAQICIVSLVANLDPFFVWRKQSPRIAERPMKQESSSFRVSGVADITAD